MESPTILSKSWLIFQEVNKVGVVGRRMQTKMGLQTLGQS